MGCLSESMIKRGSTTLVPFQVTNPRLEASYLIFKAKPNFVQIDQGRSASDVAIEVFETMKDVSNTAGH